jgi:nitric oxide dioxygenase
LPTIVKLDQLSRIIITMLNAGEIDLVRTSYSLALARSPAFAETFYHRLFEAHPFVRAIFPDEMVVQERALTATLAIVVAGLDDLGPMLPIVHDLARRHVGYGVRADQYPIIGEVLIGTFGEVLGARFTPAMAAAWGRAYDAIAAEMIAAAYPCVSSPPSRASG